MANEIKMPQLSDTMYSGKILTWNKKVGDVVNRGDILAEVETDKANLEIESFFGGVLLEIRTPANSVANVGDVIAVLGEAGESTTAKPSAAAPVAVAPVAVSPATTPAAAPQQVASSIPSYAQASTFTADTTATHSSDRIIASPLAKKIAQTHSVDLSGVTGTGPNGRIVKKDIEGVLGNVAVETIEARRPAAAA